MIDPGVPPEAPGTLFRRGRAAFNHEDDVPGPTLILLPAPGTLFRRGRAARNHEDDVDGPTPIDQFEPRPAGWRSAGARLGPDPAFSLGARGPGRR